MLSLAGVLALSFLPSAGADGVWQAPKPVSAQGGEPSKPRVVFVAQGNATAAWTRSDGANARVEVATRPTGGAFSAASFVSPAGQSASDPGLAVAPDGTAIAAWKQESYATAQIHAAVRPAGGSFAAPVALSAQNGGPSKPRVAFDSQGNATALWKRSDRIEVATRPAGGAFSAASFISAAGQS
ncbi:MAG: hypothetical protein M3N16_07375, partial [Actinomycetota bacterium]|nr:hypothetical protein [Actinomycetota bacterium]